MLVRHLISLAVCLLPVLACDGCYGPQEDVVLTRHVRRMQPEALNATTGPRAPLAWGQINFLHTTDTHGWLEGHIKEENYGADWGDFVAFTKQMRSLAQKRDVDLLLIDTGDLHDGNGLSDATVPNGNISNAIFEKLDYDILTIGNHELYITDIAYETFNNFSKVYGDRYVTSNVQIQNPATGQFEYIGSKYRYFTTAHGLRIMAFGVLYDFTGNSNVSRIIKAADLVKQQWFLDAVNFNETIDLFILAGHNPINPSDESSTLGFVQKAIRNARPDVPIQIFGGHSHIRDFYVYDTMSTGLESGTWLVYRRNSLIAATGIFVGSGRYCETLGFMSMTGIKSKTFHGNQLPPGVPHPSQPAVAVNASVSATTSPQPTGYSYGSPPALLYFRRYLDWNRRTFAYHAPGSQDLPIGPPISAEITAARKQLNLSAVYGCAPRTYCQSCQPFEAPGNIFSLVETALATVIVNQSRADVPRLIIINTGSIRFDLVKGPFTFDDSFIVSPFTDKFQFIANVPYSIASQVITVLNSPTFPSSKRKLKRGLEASNFDFNFTPLTLLHQQDRCLNPPSTITHHLSTRSTLSTRITRRQTVLTPGYTTTDAFGTDGDDTPHSKIPNFAQPENVQANASFTTSTTGPQISIDLVFLDYIASDVIDALNSLVGAGGRNYTTTDLSYYMPPSFTTNSYLPAYAKVAWQGNLTSCPVGESVGS